MLNWHCHGLLRLLCFHTVLTCSYSTISSLSDTACALQSPARLQKCASGLARSLLAGSWCLSDGDSSPSLHIFRSFVDPASIAHGRFRDCVAWKPSSATPGPWFASCIAPVFVQLQSSILSSGLHCNGYMELGRLELCVQQPEGLIGLSYQKSDWSDLVARERISPEVFVHKVFLRPPRVMDVRAFGSRLSAQKELDFPALRAMG